MGGRIASIIHFNWMFCLFAIIDSLLLVNEVIAKFLEYSIHNTINREQSPQAIYKISWFIFSGDEIIFTELKLIEDWDVCDRRDLDSHTANIHYPNQLKRQAEYPRFIPFNWKQNDRKIFEELKRLPHQVLIFFCWRCCRSTQISFCDRDSRIAFKYSSHLTHIRSALFTLWSKTR